MPFDVGGNWYCPISGAEPLQLNYTQGTLHAETNAGSYDLVLCVFHQVHYEPTVTLQATSPIRLE